MKQELISFLSASWMQHIERIEDSTTTKCPAVAVYPSCNFFPQVLLKTLIEFADNNGYHYYIDVINDDIRMRIYKDVES